MSTDLRARPDAPPAAPVPLSAFLATIKGKPEEVWSHLLRRCLANAKLTPADWHAEISKLKNTKIS